MPRVGSSSRRRRRKASSSNSVGHDVRAERGQPPVEAGARLGHQLQHRPVELDDLVLGGADHQPGAAGRAAPALAAAVDAPLPAHPQVRVQGQIALEAQEQVLAVGVHRPHGAARQPLGPAVEAVAGVRGLDRLDLARPTSAARTRLAAWWMVSPSGISTHRTKPASLAPGGAEPKGRVRAPHLHPHADRRSLWAPSRPGRHRLLWDEVGPQWANVNSCDSGSHTVGVRASQAGDAVGRRDVHALLLPVAARRTGAWLADPRRRIGLAGRRRRPVAGAARPAGTRPSRRRPRARASGSAAWWRCSGARAAASSAAPRWSRRSAACAERGRLSRVAP